MPIHHSTKSAGWTTSLPAQDSIRSIYSKDEQSNTVDQLDVERMLEANVEDPGKSDQPLRSPGPDDGIDLDNTLSADWVLIDNELELPANPRRDANLKKVEDGDKKHKKQIDYPEILTSKVGSRRVPIPRPAVSYREEVIQYLAEHSAEIVLYQQELEARLATSINQNSNAQEQEQTAMMSKPQVTHQSSQLEADECGVGSTEGSESEE